MKDRFSKHANQYALFRPTYPQALYEFIYKQVHHFDTAWDSGTGNGQVAQVLSKKFKEVYATDISAKQIEHAYRAENIFYSIANEQTSFSNQSIDLITVAQAAHWFNMDLFTREAKRVLKPDGKIAMWGYGLLSINEAIDPLIQHFYKEVIDSYWDIERKHIDHQYADLQFPFNEIQAPSFVITTSWTLEQLSGYISTWSSVQKYIQAHGYNPVDKLMLLVKDYWNGEKQFVNFPLFLRIGGMR